MFTMLIYGHRADDDDYTWLVCVVRRGQRVTGAQPNELLQQVLGRRHSNGTRRLTIYKRLGGATVVVAAKSSAN